MDIYTIGFTQTTAERFFGRLTAARVERLLDVRLHRSSQLAGFAKAQDLPYFLRELAGAAYAHEPLLAPTPEMLAGYRSGGGEWETYEQRFLALLAERRVQDVLSPGDFAARTALLCSEATAERCHRRLVCEYLAQHWDGVRAVHL